MVDPWTFQLEVRERSSSETAEDTSPDSPQASRPSPKRVTSLQLRAGGMNYFCLHAKTRGEQTKWRTLIESYVSELARHRSITLLQQRAMDSRRSVTFNAMDVELERVMDATTAASEAI